MPPDNNPTIIHLAIPKGRIEAGVTGLLSAAGIQLRSGPRGYRPVSSAPGYEVKLLKPQTIVEMLTAGSRDVGFTGADWVAETGADLVELLDTGLDPVRMVVAAPESLLEDGELPARPLVVASEYGSLTRRWIERRELDATFVRSYGATEVFPPEDAGNRVGRVDDARRKKCDLGSGPSVSTRGTTTTPSTRRSASHRPRIPRLERAKQSQRAGKIHPCTALR